MSSKKFVVLFVSFILSVVVSGQEKGLKVKYSETHFMNLKMDMPPQMAANMPKSRQRNKILLANETASLYIPNKEDKVMEEPNSDRGGRGSMRMRGVDPVTYQNFDESVMSTYTDLFGKEFLIEEPIIEFKWKLHSGEQREILGYNCTKATTMKDTIEVIAWFTTKIPHSIGPVGYSGLPGLILAVSEGESRVILATSVEQNIALPQAIEKPTKGEKVSRTEFDKIRDEKVKEMRAMYGGGGQGGRSLFIRQ